MPTLRSHTYLQATQAITQTKACKKVCLPNRTDIATLDRHRSTEKNNEHLTAPTRNWRFSASYDSFVVAQTFVLRLNIWGENRQLLVAANRYA